MRVGIIGGGAAGFFAAIAVKENYPEAKVVIIEKSRQLLSKVKVSGGGRCNLTNACDPKDLFGAYPRGGRSLKKAFHLFNNQDCVKWFESRGVPLVIQDDKCIFPVSQDSQSIIDCFLNECKRLDVEIQVGLAVKSINPQGEQFELVFDKNDVVSGTFDKLIVTTGGSPQRKGLEWLESLGHKIECPVPSLFTFNMPDEAVTKLMGIVVENAMVTLPLSKLKAEGPLLITHWGMSGPAVLKLSAFGARMMSERNYDFKILVNWLNSSSNDSVIEYLNQVVEENTNKMLGNYRPQLLPDRLWQFLLIKGDLSPQKRWGELGKKGINKLLNLLTNDEYTVKGKTTFRDEFVTCGGVSLESVDMTSMQSKKCKNLYFAGEVLDIDAITGGYNLQAAWSTGFLAGKLK
ncbi:NAD(P)/FAD-dependent oxidoreductase [Ancylomarina sp. 16SWW S1-10-2]|uniref:NAD(P)/FAD-dependent oxidoreductase n=1 Tax=Ancylomarina sp. 16SWW S1-10-2 TaxID=2499681 RepID=UPI0012AD4EFD|nr:NAD(P)/FAD-dependent oxidoreductase [Ancylomarina sp. 16SWW S1-10-2]MRT93003.1 NAD(P)/FAD-dependent oxidoreductase [Ancylomarina sp. 16SWW S1-10-2]